MKTLNLVTRIFLILTGLATLNIALQAMADPQSVMNFVDVQLNNATARNSIRAFYGSVNLAFALFWLYAAFRDQRTGLILAFLYTGGFAIGRLVSIALEGIPGAFALQWLMVESVFAGIAIALFLGQLHRPASGRSLQRA